MRDYGREELEDGRPGVPPRQAIEHCLGALYADRTHEITELVVPRLSFEELIGALLMARDLVDEAEGGYE